VCKKQLALYLTLASLAIACDVLHDMLLCYACRRHQVSLLAYSPLAGGVLSGKYVKPNPPAGARLNLFPGAHLTCVNPKLYSGVRFQPQPQPQNPSTWYSSCW
jgi:aryl-alcohol dehydrogenase-like predicted oxidoreductase